MSVEIEKKRKTPVRKKTAVETNGSVERSAATKGTKRKPVAFDSANVKQWPTHEQIAALAHRYFVERGWKHGFHEQDWYRAEQELMAAS